MSGISRGFTFIEALVVVAIASVSLGVVLPGVQRLRESACRAKCTEHLKQLGQAAGAFEAAKGGLPYSAITKNNNLPPHIPYENGFEAKPGKFGGTVGRSSGLVPLLPYLGKNNGAEIYVFGADWSDPVNAKALVATLATFRCPSEPYQDAAVAGYETTYVTPGNDAFAPPASPGSNTNILAKKTYPTAKANVTGWASDYAPFTHIKTLKDAKGSETAYANPLVAAAYPAKAIPSPGAMRVNTLTKVIEIIDGTSNTILYAEAAGRSRRCFADGKCEPFDAKTPAGPIWADADNRLILTGTDATGKADVGKGKCAVNCTNTQGDLYSFHPTGANVVFADGSVRFVKQSVAIEVLAALVTRSGGETINPDNY